jgi:hypothetical protein
MGNQKKSEKDSKLLQTKGDEKLEVHHNVIEENVGPDLPRGNDGEVEW